MKMKRIPYELPCLEKTVHQSEAPKEAISVGISTAVDRADVK
jgi:hypothetical protein